MREGGRERGRGGRGGRVRERREGEEGESEGGRGGRVSEDMFCVDLLNALITVVSFTVSLPRQLNDTDPERRDELTEREEREGPLKPTGDCLIVTGTLPTSHVILVRGCELTVHVNVSISGINGLTGSVNDWSMNISCISVINNNFNNFNCLTYILRVDMWTM